MKRIILAILLLSTIVFAQVTVSPNMSLPIPIPGVTTGPEWADDINSSLTIIDNHNHSAGQGVQINPDGINVNSDFPMNNNNLTTIKTTRFFSQSSAFAATSPNIGAIYVVGNELYYNDYSGGHQVQITNGGSVNAGAGSITGLPSGTASASYAAGVFSFQSATNTPADLNVRSILLGNNSTSSNRLTLSPPTLGSSYSLIFPALPSQTNVMTLDTSGNMGSITYDAVGSNMTATGANAIMNTQTELPFADWTSYTPTLTGMVPNGSATPVAFIWRKIGQSIEVMGQVNPASVNGSLFSISLPGGYTIASYLPQASSAMVLPIGTLLRQVASPDVLYITATPTVTTTVFAGKASGSNDPTIRITGSDIGNVSITVHFTVPVQ